MNWYIKIQTKSRRWSMATWPFMWLRINYSERTVKHEEIHFKQQLELLIVPFYILYFIFHLINGYRGNPFEMEAYEYDDKPGQRKPYGWLKYFK